MSNLRARLLFLVLCAASADALAQYVCIATDGESRSHYATGVIAQPTREMLEDFKLFVRKEYDLLGEPTASCGYQVTTADAKNFLASTKGIVRTGWQGHSAQGPSGTDVVNDDVAADTAEEWRIAEFISKGPLMPPSPQGPGSIATTGSSSSSRPRLASAMPCTRPQRTRRTPNSRKPKNGYERTIQTT